MFNTICFYLNRIGLSRAVAVLRWVLHKRLASRAVEGAYQQPDAVGYRGWITLRGLGPVAFRRLDGSLQYRW